MLFRLPALAAAGESAAAGGLVNGGGRVSACKFAAAGRLQLLTESLTVAAAAESLTVAAAAGLRSYMEAARLLCDRCV